ncbi:DNA primase [Rickettsia endosymbiont of Culicoides newsteadi]|uniref:DNA primase n=1 Tax=Rickettsia endosymbiont of Culicoides newsteadi TaxID=1961830 RepID=UPI000B9AF2BD|nr:DNA primase [Rickettsia endosymbiont of Culicoides newsteadi]OZG31782.1 DNA primase [Rickettsia endosymbiont of Culicoides newsteadi]
MRIPLEFYELLRTRINLSDIVRQKVVLTKKSGNYLGLCPFHVEKSPSFTVNDAKRFYYCFGCTVHGDVIKFVASLNGLSYKEAAIKLANDYGIELPKLTVEQQKLHEESDELLDILGIAERFFTSQLSQEVCNYLRDRGISKEAIKEFSIGFAPPAKELQKFFEKKSISLKKLQKAGLVGKGNDGTMYEIFYNRIIFPIRNIYNKVIGFGGRVIGNGLPKYLNSPETILFQKNETLYGENNAISVAYKKNHSILVEGYLDVIALHQAGFKETVASLGTAVTENHLQKLWRAGDEIALCLDGDMAGIKATQRVINLVLPLINGNKKISFVMLPGGSDPNDIINKDGAGGFAKIFDKRINLSEMIWRSEYEGKSFVTPEDKAILEKNLEDYCKQIKDRTLSHNYYRYFKEQIWQNLIKRQSKGGVRNSNVIFSAPDYSEIEMLEQVFCMMLVKFPEIVNKQEIKDFLLTLNFQNKMLEDFRDWYFAEIISNDVLDHENIIDLAEKAGFYETFSLLSKSNNLFLDLSFNKNDIDSDLLWQWLHKKHHLVLLKQEYSSIIQNGTDEELKKAMLYREEIMRVSKELYNLNESFTN